MGKPERKSSLVKPRRWWEDNINSSSGFGAMDWIDLAQDKDISRLLWMR